MMDGIGPEVGALALVPTGPHITVSWLSRRRVRVSWRRVLRAAKKDWHLTTEQVDLIVRAAVTDDSSYGAGWAVVADVKTYDLGTSANSPPIAYARLVIVVEPRSR